MSVWQEGIAFEFHQDFTIGCFHPSLTPPNLREFSQFITVSFVLCLFLHGRKSVPSVFLLIQSLLMTRELVIIKVYVQHYAIDSATAQVSQGDEKINILGCLFYILLSQWQVSPLWLDGASKRLLKPTPFETIVPSVSRNFDKPLSPLRKHFCQGGKAAGVNGHLSDWSGVNGSAETVVNELGPELSNRLTSFRQGAIRPYLFSH